MSDTSLHLDENNPRPVARKHSPAMVFLTTLTAIAVAVGVGVILVALRDDFAEFIKSLF